MAVQIEDAGFEIRDLIAWVYGSGFPKSLDVSKAIDKAAGAEREVVGSYTVTGTAAKGQHKGRAAASADQGSAANCAKALDITAPATLAAQQWAGWGTALKPALEPITVARKPFKGTVAANVLAHGTGGINVDGCRVATDERIAAHYGTGGGAGHTTGKFNQPYQRGDANAENTHTMGRWPANLIYDGSDEPCALLGDAARFFYCAKASKADRGDGNVHPTVKPTELMRYLCRLVTPPGGVVLDPFMGSGSTGKAAALEGFKFIGIEREAEYLEIARGRIELPAQGSLL
jgi:site-specific DNA-methyltransferase (adenine-specific)